MSNTTIKPFVTAIYDEFDPESYAGLRVTNEANHIAATINLGNGCGQPMSPERLETDIAAVRLLFGNEDGTGVNFSSSIDNLRQDMRKSKSSIAKS